MTQDQLRIELRKAIAKRTTQRKASVEIGIGYGTLLNFLGGANVEERTLSLIKSWIESNQ